MLEYTGALEDYSQDNPAVTTTTVLDGAQVQIANNVNVVENFNLSGPGNGNNGALYSISGANAIFGTMYLTQNASFVPTSTPSPTDQHRRGRHHRHAHDRWGHLPDLHSAVATITFTATPASAITVYSATGISVTPSGSATTVQTLTFGIGIGSTFVLTYNGTQTAGIAWNANPTVESQPDSSRSRTRSCR